ncbi:transglycosylase SLT domain-containing protein [Jannaschia sp. W003]|uniref:transglycosylase SLT domain-containing protein n=1 Tax=Jannaschia sp. W003 TaxID=2867012 RepID=UPI0021A8C8F2|nr:transglycosylase SLT domain-containing protein [Jannaschia sp. W003]UWQ22777.1 transglycosylase SLT domain-containing protein [Jannaschia sp. W003]
MTLRPTLLAAAVASLAAATAPPPATAQQMMPRPDLAALRAVLPEPRPAPGYEIPPHGLEALAAALLAETAPLDGDVLIEAVLEPRTGGLERMRDRGFLRMAVAPDPLMIAFDGERALGVAVEIARELELFLAAQPGASPTPTVVVPTPMPRREIAANVIEGLTDFTTLTVSRADEDPALAYTRPLIADVVDVPVLGAGVEGVETLDDLAGIPVYLSEDSRYARGALRLNAEREAAGEPPLDLRFVDGRLDDYDLIEMVEIGLIPATVASDFKARFWQTAYEGTVVREDLALSEPARIAWSVRASNPELLAVLDDFAETAREGTLLGNVVLKRYMSTADWIENIGTDEARGRIAEVGPVIEKYAAQFEFDPELLIAQAYQESQLDQTRRSHVGAVGVMQVMPATAADPVVGIPAIDRLDDNVHAGVKYLRWLRDTFFDAPDMDPLDRTLLAFAAYNAGPGGVRRAQRRAEEMGLDPDVWFENVELAIQRAVSREPAIYVRNIFKYYVSYRLLAELDAQAAAPLGDMTGLEDEIADLAPAERERFVREELGIVVPAPEGAPIPVSADR